MDRQPAWPSPAHTPEFLQSMISLTFVTTAGPLDISLLPDGTAGYEDLARGQSQVTFHDLGFRSQASMTSSGRRRLQAAKRIYWSCLPCVNTDAARDRAVVRGGAAGLKRHTISARGRPYDARSCSKRVVLSPKVPSSEGTKSGLCDGPRGRTHRAGW